MNGRGGDGGGPAQYTVNLTERADEALAAIIDQTGDTEADAFNRAVEVYARVVQCDDDGTGYGRFELLRDGVHRIQVEVNRPWWWLVGWARRPVPAAGPDTATQLAAAHRDLAAAGDQTRTLLDRLAEEREAHAKTQAQLAAARERARTAADVAELRRRDAVAPPVIDLDAALARQAAQDRANAVALAAENAELREELVRMRAERAGAV